MIEDRPIDPGVRPAAHVAWPARNAILLLGALLLAVVLIAGAVVLLSGRGPAPYPADSPEYTLQAFITAWNEDDIEAAYNLLSARVRQPMSLARYRQQARDYAWQREQDQRVVLLGTRPVGTGGDRVIVDLRVDQYSSGPFGSDRWSSERRVRLVREDGAWRIDEPLAGLEPFYGIEPAYEW
jgi:hypothetical protein